MRKSVWSLLFIITLLLAACGPAVRPTTDGQTPSGEVFLLALPRLVVDFDRDGNPSMLGLTLSDITGLIGVDSSQLQLNKLYVDWMTTANVQHIEMRHTGDGLALVVNGQPLPRLAWDDASLQQASELALLFDVPADKVNIVKELLPMIRRLGLDVVLTFPLRPGAKPIPLADPAIATAKVKPEEAPSMPIIKFEIKYDQQGVPAILGVSAQDLAALGFNAPLALRMDYVRALQTHNIQYVELRINSGGLHVYVNGSPLPNLVWDSVMLTNSANLYVQMNPTSPYIAMVKQVVPTLNTMDIAILVHFPLAAGAQPIPAKIH
jgi:sulfur carrier protein ThiS